MRNLARQYLPKDERLEITRGRLRHLLAGSGAFGRGNRNRAIRYAVETLAWLGEPHDKIMEMFE